MYELPSIKNLSKVVIDEGVVEGQSAPILIYEDAKKRAESAS